MASIMTRVLILCKTYPSPSAKYAETSCVAGMGEDGKLIRLYPVPFRLIGDDRQFKKWQWITARLEKSRNDHRPESHKLYVDTIVCDTAALPTSNQWLARRPWLDKLPVFESLAGVEAARQADGTTLALLRPGRILGLDITPVNSPDWTEDEKGQAGQPATSGRSVRRYRQGQRRPITQTALRLSLPLRMHDAGRAGGASAQNRRLGNRCLVLECAQRSRPQLGKTVSEKLETSLPGQDLMFLLGTIHRFPDQWLLISLIYPPKQRPWQEAQELLF